MLWREECRMKNNEIKNLSFIRVAFANGIMMFLIVLLSEALKGSINFNNCYIMHNICIIYKRNATRWNRKNNKQIIRKRRK